MSGKDLLTIGGKNFKSRLMVVTGLHKSNKEMVDSIRSSEAEIITVAIGRIDLNNSDQKSILDFFDWNKYTLLPNTAGSKTAKEAIYTAELARELTGTSWIKLEVIPDSKYLLPDPVQTFEAAEYLVKNKFTVLPYINADPVLAKKLEDIGCATVMPLGSSIGSGNGIHTLEEIKIIIEQSNVPVVVDAGLAVPSDAAIAMEIGADCVLVNTAIAQARDPLLMGNAFKLGVEAGRKAYLAGRIPKIDHGKMSSPDSGI
jgi:thiazole synthase